MDFAGQQNLGNLNPPSKVYIFSNGLDVFTTSPDNLSPVEYYAGLVKSAHTIFIPAEFVIAFVLGDIVRKERIVRAYCCNFPMPQNGLPRAQLVEFREHGHQNTRTDPLFRGEEIVVLGKEMQLRRECTSLRQYMRAIPDFSGSTINIGLERSYVFN